MGRSAEPNGRFISWFESSCGIRPWPRPFFLHRVSGHYWEEAQRLGWPVITLDLPNGHAFGHLRSAAAAMRPFDLHHFHSAEPLLMLASVQCRGARRVYTHRGGQHPLLRDEATSVRGDRALPSPRVSRLFREHRLSQHDLRRISFASLQSSSRSPTTASNSIFSSRPGERTQYERSSSCDRPTSYSAPLLI